MTIAPPQRSDPEHVLDEEALIKQARQRQRRRYAAWVAAVVVLLVVALFLVERGGNTRPTIRPAQVKNPSSVGARPLPVGADVALKLPGALGVSGDGTLYVVDDARDQVLERQSNGKFAVVAGNGNVGFSGDGGPAVDAELNDPAGLAVAPSGALYIADRGNGRVREVLLNGTIKTVAGNGTRTWSQQQEPALRASLNTVSALALGSSGELYMGGDELSVLRRNGTVDWLAGSLFPAGCGGSAVEATFTTIAYLAVDRPGDVYVAGENCKEIAERTTGGKLIDVEQRGNGEGVIPIASTGTGAVFAGGGDVSRLGSNSPGPYARFDPNEILGRRQSFYVHQLAVGKNGTIYVDEDAGDGLSTVSAIAEIPPDAPATLLWKS